MSQKALRNRKERLLFTAFPDEADKQFKKVKRNLHQKEKRKEQKYKKSAQEIVEELHYHEQT
ncbi:hypothetical protein ACFL2K_03920 [Candidatus Margulisiibacteriota bacterium]